MGSNGHRGASAARWPSTALKVSQACGIAAELLARQGWEPRWARSRRPAASPGVVAAGRSRPVHLQSPAVRVRSKRRRPARRGVRQRSRVRAGGEQRTLAHAAGAMDPQHRKRRQRRGERTLEDLQLRRAAHEAAMGCLRQPVRQRRRGDRLVTIPVLAPSGGQWPSSPSGQGRTHVESRSLDPSQDRARRAERERTAVVEAHRPPKVSRTPSADVSEPPARPVRSRGAAR